MSETYDLIIVGAGTAGSVLAERLSHSGRLRVLLIEAGGPPKSRFVSIPAGFPRLFKSAFDWAFESEPQTSVGGRRIFTPRGKMLGGSANLNAMLHQWCHPADFDGWAEAGASEWSWRDVAPVFREQECWLGDGGSPERGRDGLMPISPNRNARRLTRQFVEAARRAGLGSDTQYNGRAYQGAWVAELALRGGKRFSVWHACLEPAMRRENLRVLTDAQATRIVIDGGRATGVVVRRSEGERTFAARGVVLAAGALASPQLLMLSGIGPAPALRKLGLAVHVDLPGVGENLQDHPLLPVVFSVRGKDTLRSAESPLSLFRYLAFKRGMLASNGIEGFAFTQIRWGPVAAPDLELVFAPFEWRDQGLQPPQQHAYSIGVAVVAPRSRGRLSLRSPDPLAPPAIDFGLLSDPEGVDASVLCEGVRLSRTIAATSPLAEESIEELRPGVAAQSDHDLLAYAGAELQTVYHPTSSCRMGVDPGSVVDPRLCVRGVDGLWVADAAVMPTVPRGHPNAVVAMIAGRAARWIESEVVA